MYKLFIVQFISFLVSKGLTKRASMGVDIELIRNTERELAKSLPLSVVEWFLLAGEYSAEWQDYDSDLTLRDLINSQKVAITLINDPECGWSLTDMVLPISARIGGEFYFVMTDMGDDPPVYHYMESTVYPTHISNSFTSFIRERALDLIDLRFRQATIQYSNSQKSQRVIELVNEHYPDFELMRKIFLDNIHTENISKRYISSADEIQSRWVQQIGWLNTTKILMSENIHVPWNWT